MAGSKKAMTMPGAIARGIGASMGLTLLGAMALAWLMATERIPETAIGWGVMGILVISTLTGCLTAWRGAQRRRMLICGLCSAGYYLALLVVSLLFGGQITGMGTTALAVLAGGAMALSLGLVGNSSGGHRHKIPRYR